MNLNKETFEAWLFSQPRERVIEAGHTTKCFICSFLRETYNATTPVVDWEVWGSFDQNSQPMQRLPDWAKQLIDRDWVNETCQSVPYTDITVGQMQDRWRMLWPEPKEQTNEPQTKTHSDQKVAA